MGDSVEAGRLHVGQVCGLEAIGDPLDPRRLVMILDWTGVLRSVKKQLFAEEVVAG